MYKNCTFAGCLKRFMKNFIVLTILIVTLASCSPYQKALKSTDNDLKLAMIDTLMKKGKYNKTIPLFEQVVTQYSGTDKAPELGIKYGDALFATRLYPTAVGQFQRFTDTYSFDEKAEYATFMVGKSKAQMTRSYGRDQENTKEALALLQDYINAYPEGKYIQEANEEISKLRSLLDKKAYEIAKNYHHREAYIPAIKAFENFITDHPGSEFQDDAQFYLFDSEYQYAILSIDALVGERLAIAEKYYKTFISRYPSSEYRKDADKLMEKINENKFKNNNL